MAYQYITQYTSPNQSKGRPAGKPNVIVIHYWDRPEVKPKFDGVVSWLCRPNGSSSAHYVVEAGKVACLVSPNDRAWHAGPLGNPRGIGIECNPRNNASDRETVAELIADLREAYGNLPLRPHKAYMNTSCPGNWANYLDWLSNRANQILAARKKGGSSGLSPAPVPQAPSGKLAIDGYWGAGTTRALQKVLGTTQDGVVSSQSNAWKSRNPGLTTGWVWTSKPRGSRLIIALQKRIGVTADGMIGPTTINALSARFGIKGDGRLDAGSITIKAMQQALNRGTF